MTIKNSKMKKKQREHEGKKGRRSTRRQIKYKSVIEVLGIRIVK